MSDAEKKKLVAEALAPLSAAELEVWRHNRVQDTIGAQLKGRLREMAGAIAQWQADAMASVIKKGIVPEWVTDPARRVEAAEAIRAAGINFRGGGFHWELRKGEEVLSVLDFKINGATPTQ